MSHLSHPPQFDQSNIMRCNQLLYMSNTTLVV